MNNIDEIALRVAKAYEALSSLDDCARMDIGVDAIGPRKVLEQFIADVEKLAELSKDAVPVAFVQATPDGNLMLAEITKTAEAQQLDQWDRQMGWTLVPLFTHQIPANTAEIEQRVAEAVIEYLFVEGVIGRDGRFATELKKQVWREYL